MRGNKKERNTSLSSIFRCSSILCSRGRQNRKIHRVSLSGSYALTTRLQQASRKGEERLANGMK